MFEQSEKRYLVKHILVLAGVAVGAFWLGSRMLAPSSEARDPLRRTVTPAAATAPGPAVALGGAVAAGQPHQFLPPRIEPTETVATPTVLEAKATPAPAVAPPPAPILVTPSAPVDLPPPAPAALPRPTRLRVATPKTAGLRRASRPVETPRVPATAVTKSIPSVETAPSPTKRRRKVTKRRHLQHTPDPNVYRVDEGGSGRFRDIYDTQEAYSPDSDRGDDRGSEDRRYEENRYDDRRYEDERYGGRRRRHRD
jgi:hypothetical protein